MRLASGLVGGAVIGGAISGAGALIKGNNFWTGAPKALGRSAFSFKKQPKYTSNNTDYSISSGTNSTGQAGSVNGGNVERTINPDAISDTLENFGIRADKNNPIFKSSVDKWLNQIDSPNFNATKNVVGGFFEGAQRALITEGHHRVVAAAIHGMRTGDYTVLSTFINSENFGNYSSSFGYKFVKFPNIWR